MVATDTKFFVRNILPISSLTSKILRDFPRNLLIPEDRGEGVPRTGAQSSVKTGPSRSREGIDPVNPTLRLAALAQGRLLRRERANMGRLIKIVARFGATHEKFRPGGFWLGNPRREDQGTWRLAREDARESARHHPRG